LEKGVDDELQQGAIGGIGNMRSPHVAGAILSGFAHYNQENRGLALDALLKDSARISALLDAVEAGTIKPTDLGPARIAKLTHSADSAIRVRARKLLTTSGGQGRRINGAKVVAIGNVAVNCRPMAV